MLDVYDPALICVSQLAVSTQYADLVVLVDKLSGHPLLPRIEGKAERVQRGHIKLITQGHDLVDNWLSPLVSLVDQGHGESHDGDGGALHIPAAPEFWVLLTDCAAQNAFSRR